MKVALISHQGGGISSVCYELAQSLSKKRIHTTVITGVHRHDHQTKRVNDYLEIVRLPTLDLPPRSLWFQIFNTRKLSKLLKNHTVIHGVSPDASFLYTFFKRKLKKPFVATIHGSPRASQRAFINSPISYWTLGDFGYEIVEFPLHDFTVRKILSASDHIAVCSFAALEELKVYRSLDLSKVSVVYNGINLEEIGNLRASSTDQIDDLSIIYAGRLFWTKGVMLLLEAFKLLRQDRKNIHLSIFGKGPLENRIREFITNSGLRANVHFQGYVPREELLAEVKNSDVVVFPSLSEAQPVFVLEAMACRKPLVAFNIPSMREMISNFENGLLAEPYKAHDLCGRIEMLLSDRKLRSKLGENAYNYVKRKHSWNEQAEKYIEIYEKVDGNFGN
jgi:glycosyltransferase involved in cell wall biosynthesis